MTKMTKVTKGLTLLVFAASLLCYQNCGLQNINSYGNNQSQTNFISTLASPVPGAAEAFTAGSVFNYSLVPVQSQMVQVQLDDSNYLASTMARAVAINAEGLGFVSQVIDGNQSEADQIALEGCFAIGGSQPCALLATAGTFAINASDLNWSATFSTSIVHSQQFNAAEIPFLAFSDRKLLASGYINAQSPKAMAISLDGTFMVASASGGFGAKTDSRASAVHLINVPSSESEAQRMALELCEMMSKYMPCQLYAVDANVVFNPQQINFQPILNVGAAVVTEVPGLSSAIFNAEIAPAITLGHTIYLSADGAYGDNANSVLAFNQCATERVQINSGTYPCFEYAVGSTLQSLVANLTAVASHSMNTHCKVMPRSSCAAHASVGCTAGSFYIAPPNTIPTLQTCP